MNWLRLAKRTVYSRSGLVVVMWCVFANVATPSGAQVGASTVPTRMVTVIEAAEHTLRQYPSVAAAQSRVTEAQAAVGEARAARQPTVQLRATTTQFQKDMLVSPIHGLLPSLAPPFDQTLLQSAVAASYPLYDGSMRRTRIAQTERLADAAGQAAASVAQLVTAQVVTTYGRVVSRRRVLDAHDGRLRALEAEEQRATRLLEAGKAPRLDVLRAAAALASAVSERVTLAEGLDAAERELARLMGVSVDETRAERLQPFGLGDDVGRDRSALVAMARRQSPAVREARLRLDAADLAIRLTDSEQRPRLDIVGNVLGFGSAQGHFTAEWSAGVQVSYPLFTGGVTGHRLAKARAARTAEAGLVRVAELRVDAEVDRALSAAAEAAARLDSLRAAEARFAEIVRIEQLRLDTGPGIQTDYLRAEADLLTMRASLEEAAYAAVAARVELARVVGELDITWLRTHITGQP